MKTLRQDLQYGLRMLARSPGFTAVVVVILAVGIGATTAVFSVVNALLLRPLPFREPQRLVTAWERDPQRGYEMNNVAPATLADWKAQNRVFEKMAAFFGVDLELNLTGDGEPQRIVGVPVSADLFELLGVGPLRGRTFLSAEETPGQDQVVILSHGLWQQRFGRDPQVLGKTITLDGRSHLVVGVMPPGFAFPGMTGILYGFHYSKPADLWLPLALPAEKLNDRSYHLLEVVARLKPGVTLTQARTEMDALMQRIERANPGNLMGTHAKVISLREQSLAAVRPGLLVLMGAVVFVLLIACANVANLQLTRAAARQKDLAMRLALGAKRLQVIRQLLAENILLAVLGGTLGVLFVSWGLDLVTGRIGDTVALTTPGWNDIRIDRRVLGFTFLVSLAAGILCGLAPALQVTKLKCYETLKEAGRGSIAGLSRHRFRRSLVVTQVALALILLTGTGLMLQSLFHLQRVNPGFDPSHVLTMVLNLPESRYTDGPQVAAFYRELLVRLRSLPGVQWAGATSQLPLSGDLCNVPFEIEGRPPATVGQWDTADLAAVTPDYGRVMQIPLRAGRFLGEQDTREAPLVCVINQAMAQRYFPGEDPIGKRLRLKYIGDAVAQIVGVVEDVRQRRLDIDALAPATRALFDSQIHVAYLQLPLWSRMTVVVRSPSDATTLGGGLRAKVRELDRDLPVPQLRTMEAVRSGSIAQARFRTLLLELFGLLALLLATVGVYAVVAYSVAQRTREIGIRMALGATSQGVVKSVVGQGFKLALIGTGLGLAGAFGLTRLLVSLLYNISPTDPLTFILVPLVLICMALLASYLPARRAASIDPMTALRYE